MSELASAVVLVGRSALSPSAHPGWGIAGLEGAKAMGPRRTRTADTVERGMPR